MSDRSHAQSLVLIAAIVLVAVAGWFLFPSGGGSGDDSATNQHTVAGEEESGDLEAGRVAGSELGPARTTGKGGERSARREQADGTALVSGTIATGAGGLGDTFVSLRKPPASQNTFATMFTFTDPKQFERLKDVFGKRKDLHRVPVEPSGRFVFEDLRPGRYELALMSPLLRMTARTEFTIAAGEERDLGVIATEAASALLVVVTDTSGDPVANAKLKLNSDIDPMSFANPEKLADFTKLFREFIPEEGATNARGVHRFPGIRKAGRFLLSVEAAKHSPKRVAVRLIDGMQKIVRVQLSRAASLRARVLDTAGQPIANARVSVMPEADPQEPTGFVSGDRFTRVRGRTKESGVVTLDSIRPGAAEIKVRAKGYLSESLERVLRRGETLEVECKLDSGFSVSGVVLDSRDQPIAGAHVVSAPQLAASFMGIELSSLVPSGLLAEQAKQDGAVTGEDGKFTVTGLREEDKVHLFAAAEGFAAGRLGPVKPRSKGHVIRLTRLASIVGRVLVEETGEPVPEFEVWCSQTQYLVFEGKLGDAKREKDGRFELTRIPQGKQTLVIEAPGRTPYRGVHDIVAGPLDVGDIALAPASAIEGVVVGLDGAPIEGASVRLSKGGFSDFAMLAQMRGEETATTDASGSFRLAEVPARRVKLIAEKKGYALKKSKIVRVLRGKTTGGVRIELDTGGSLVGKIVDDRGRPQIGFRVQLTGMRTATVRMETTDETGTVRAVGLAPGVYQIQAFPPDWMQSFSKQARQSGGGSDAGVPDNLGDLMSSMMKSILQTTKTVRAGKETEFKLVYERPENASELTRVDGFVTIGGAPVEGGFVELLELGGAPGTDFAQVRDGVFEYRGVRPGSYRVRVRAGFLSAAAFHDEIIRIPKRERHRLELKLPGGRIAGRVVQKKDGKPAAHVIVKITRQDDTRHFNPVRLEDVGQGMWLTDSKGRFSVDGLAAGTYVVLAQSMTFMTGKDAGGAAERFVLGAGQRREDVELRLGVGGKVTVRVTDEKGPKSQALVRLVDRDGRPSGMFQVAVTDRAGVATLSGVAAGSYRVLADAETASPTLSRALQIEESSEQEVDIKLETGVEVRLVVEGERPQPRTGEVLVYSVWDPDGKLVRAGPAPLETVLGMATKKAGGMTFGQLRPGNYRLRLESPSIGVFEAEREVPAQKRVVWAVDLARRTVEKR